LILQLISACSQPNLVERKIIGSCCGECYGDCFSGYLIENDAVFKISGKSCEEIHSDQKIKLNRKKSEAVRHLFNMLPENYTDYSGTYGYPDCHDQCTIFISFKIEDVVTEIFLDPDSGMHPSEFDEFIEGISNLDL
jgi:hypothetical protein